MTWYTVKKIIFKKSHIWKSKILRLLPENKEYFWPCDGEVYLRQKEINKLTDTRIKTFYSSRHEEKIEKQSQLEENNCKTSNRWVRIQKEFHVS